MPFFSRASTRAWSPWQTPQNTAHAVIVERNELPELFVLVGDETQRTLLAPLGPPVPLGCHGVEELLQLLEPRGLNAVLQLLVREILEPIIHDHFPIVGPARVRFHDEVGRPGRRRAQEDGLVLGVELHAPQEPRVARSREVQHLRCDVAAVDGGHNLQIPLCPDPRAAANELQVGRARNDAVVGPNRTGGVEHGVEVGALRAAREGQIIVGGSGPHRRRPQLRGQLHAP